METATHGILSIAAQALRCCSAVCSPLQLYTQEFYRTVVAKKLAPGGIFVTQSGPAGVLSSTQVCRRPAWPRNRPPRDRLLPGRRAVRPVLACLHQKSHFVSSQLPTAPAFAEAVAAIQCSTYSLNERLPQLQHEALT